MATPNVTLLRDLVMIRAAELALSKSEGGIIVPGDLDKTAPKRATVIAAGPGTYNKKGEFVKCPVEPGDEILYMQTNVILTKIEGKEYLIIPSSEVLLKLSGKTETAIKTDHVFAADVEEKLISKLKGLGLEQLENMSAPVAVFETLGDDPQPIPLSARSFVVTYESLDEPFSLPDRTVAFSMWQVVDRVPGVNTGEFVARFAFSDRSDIKKA